MSPFASPSRRPSPYVKGLTRRRGGRGELPFAELEPRSEVPRFNLCARDSTLNLISNVFLHYVLDLWFEQDVKPRMRQPAFLIRYADDCAPGNVHAR